VVEDRPDVPLGPREGEAADAPPCVEHDVHHHLVARLGKAKRLVGEVLERVDRALHGREEALMAVAGTGHDGISRIDELELGIYEAEGSRGITVASQAPLE